MRRTSVNFAIVIAALSAICIALASALHPLRAQSGHAHEHVATTRASTESDVFGRALAAGMDRMHRDMMAPSPSGNADVDFLATMIPHHEGAVEMARLALVHGRDPLVRQLAEEIIAGQQVEIAAMQARLQILRRGANPQPDGYPALGSARGQ